jgi:hypothetical protein
VTELNRTRIFVAPVVGSRLRNKKTMARSVPPTLLALKENHAMRAARVKVIKETIYLFCVFALIQLMFRLCVLS